MALEDTDGTLERVTEHGALPQAVTDKAPDVYSNIAITYTTLHDDLRYDLGCSYGWLKSSIRCWRN